MYTTNSPVRFKNSMLRTNLCNYSNACILAKGTITVAITGTAAAPNNINEKVIFKKCAPFTSCISKINNRQMDDAQYSDANIWFDRI